MENLYYELIVDEDTGVIRVEYTYDEYDYDYGCVYHTSDVEYCDTLAEAHRVIKWLREQ